MNGYEREMMNNWDENASYDRNEAQPKSVESPRVLVYLSQMFEVSSFHGEMFIVKSVHYLLIVHNNSV